MKQNGRIGKTFGVKKCYFSAFLVTGHFGWRLDQGNQGAGQYTNESWYTSRRLVQRLDQVDQGANQNTDDSYYVS